MRASANAVQGSFWTGEEIAGMSWSAELFLGPTGRRLSHVRDMKKPPTIFRVDIFDSKAKKIWFGDIDIGKDGKVLLGLAEKLRPLYILHEIDGKFLIKKSSPRFIRNISAFVVEEGSILYSRDFAERVGIVKKRLRCEQAAEGD